MSEQAPPEPTTSNADAGVSFRAEMAVQNAIIGYWPHALGVVFLGLVGFFGYSQYQSWQAGHQKDTAARIATVEGQLRMDLLPLVDAPMRRVLIENRGTLSDTMRTMQTFDQERQSELMGGSPGAMQIMTTMYAAPENVQSALASTQGDLDTVILALGPLSADGKAKITAAADELVAIGNETHGGESTAAFVEAAEFYRLVGAIEPRKAALTQVATNGTGVLAYSAQLALAHVQLDSGDVDGAVAAIRKIGETKDTTLAQDALLEIGHVYESVGRTPDAIAIYDEFITKYPMAPQVAGVTAQKLRLSGPTAAATPAPEAPAPDAPTPETPAPAPEVAPPGTGG